MTTILPNAAQQAELERQAVGYTANMISTLAQALALQRLTSARLDEEFGVHREVDVSSVVLGAVHDAIAAVDRLAVENVRIVEAAKRLAPRFKI